MTCVAVGCSEPAHSPPGLSDRLLFSPKFDWPAAHTPAGLRLSHSSRSRALGPRPLTLCFCPGSSVLPLALCFSLLFTLCPFLVCLCLYLSQSLCLSLPICKRDTTSVCLSVCLSPMSEFLSLWLPLSVSSLPIVSSFISIQVPPWHDDNHSSLPLFSKAQSPFCFLVIVQDFCILHGVPGK